MLAQFRSEVVATLAVVAVPLWDVLPDDVAELPCLVVGRPSARQTSTAVVFDLGLQVFVIGRRQQAGAAEAELVELADDVMTALGGTRGKRAPSGGTIAVTRADPRILTIAGQDCPAYTVEVEASATTC
jgi:hypothetical protein